jgi:hypothetical protein
VQGNKNQVLLDGGKILQDKSTCVSHEPVVLEHTMASAIDEITPTYT